MAGRVPPSRSYISILVILVILAGVTGILGNLATDALPDAWRPYLWLSWPLFIVLLVVMVVLTVVQIRYEIGFDAGGPPRPRPANRNSRTASPAAEMTAGPEQPFFTGGRINHPSQFFNREQLLRELRAELNKHNSISLVGPSQIGKSSLLYFLYLTQADWSPDTWVEYIDLQRIVDESDFCETVLARLGLEGTSLRQLKRALEEQPMILLLDEVERIVEPDFSPHLHNLLRSLAQEPTFAMCVATQRPLVEVFLPSTPGGVSPFHNIFTTKLVPPFTPAEARAFLNERLASAGVRFSGAEIEHLLQESQGHPARLQKLAKELYEKHARP